MAIPLHTLNIYQKPRLGNVFMRRLPVYNYSHDINAIGGFDTAHFDIALGSVSEMQQFLDQYIGNRVAIFADNPIEPIWEGLISRMTFTAGGAQYSISLDEMINRAQVQYINTGTSATVPQTRPLGDNLISQAIYGIKRGQIDMGTIQASVNTASIDALRDNLLAQRAWPLSSITRGAGNGLLNIECLGFFHVLDWDVWADSNGLTDIRTNITWMMTGGTTDWQSANNTTFFDCTDFTDLATNALTYSRLSNRGETFWQRLVALAEIGDATSYYVIGITPTLFSTGTRRMYYRPANFNIEYTARKSDGLRIRNLYGQLVDPWRVRPDRAIRVSDQLIGWNGLGNNPTETWIRAITYNANLQTVDYRGDDDTTAQGKFQFDRVARVNGQKFSYYRTV